jgi:peptidoglycan/LPS O-acetylase OafA/YrhL
MIASMASLQLTTGSKAMKDMVLSFNRLVLDMIFAMFVALFVQQIILFQPKRKVWVKIECFMSKMADFSYTLYLSHRIVFLLLFYFFLKKELLYLIGKLNGCGKLAKIIYE